MNNLCLNISSEEKIRICTCLKNCVICYKDLIKKIKDGIKNE
jgi:hypothetical protein